MFNEEQSSLDSCQQISYPERQKSQLPHQPHQATDAKSFPAERSTVEVFLKGSGSSTQLFVPVSSGSAAVVEAVAEAVQIPPDLLHVTVEGRCLTEQFSGNQLPSGATLHYTIKGKGGMHSGDHENQQGMLKSSGYSTEYKILSMYQ